MKSNLVLDCIRDGGAIKPLLVSSDRTNGLGLMNPSIYIDNGKITGILRQTNYTFYHSERKLFQHPYGPLTYIHPENDLKLRTWNVAYYDSIRYIQSRIFCVRSVILIEVNS